MSERRYGVAHSLRALAQPWTVALVLILLLNDHVLRWRWPSWVTGKVGDMVWLGFAPLMVAVPLAFAVDAWAGRRAGRAQRSRDLPLVLATVLVGAVFAVVKASPAVAAWCREGFRAVAGWTPMLLSDPTDLLALPALGIAWALWLGPQKWVREVQVPRRAWWVMALAALATMANSGPPDTGLTCLTLVDGTVLAGARYTYAYTSTYASEDGGMSWSDLTDLSLAEEAWAESQGERCPDRGSSWVLVDEMSGAQYRFTRGLGIERSSDGGQTWSPSLALTGQESRQAYYQATRTTIEGGAGPHDALIDPATGNLVVAMGHEGVLVLPRSAGAGAADAWVWVAVGEYRFEPITRPGQVLTLLQDEILLALAAACVAVAFSAWWRMKWFGRGFAVLVALGIAVMLPAVRPASVPGYGGAAVALIAIGVAVVALPLAVVAAIRARERRVAALALGLVAGTVCLAPFLLWAVGVLQSYSAAAWIAVVGIVVVWLASSAQGRLRT